MASPSPSTSKSAAAADAEVLQEGQRRTPIVSPQNQAICVKLLFRLSTELPAEPNCLTNNQIERYGIIKMTECLCDICPLGDPNISFAVVHCLHRFTAYASERPGGAPLLAGKVVTQPAWQSNAALPHLFTRFAA